MTTLHIGNNFTAEMVGDYGTLGPVERRAAGCGATRLPWFAADGDVLVLPWIPPDDYLAYVTGLTGTRLGSLRLVVPPPGAAGPDLMSADRLADPELRKALGEALAGRPVDRVFAFYPDASVVALARYLGAEQAVPGHGFFGQGGSRPANSKAAFRAFAAGVGVPVAPGAVVTDRREAEDAIAELLEDGHQVILKRDFGQGAHGNEIISPAEGTAPYGAERVVTLDRRATVRWYLTDRWGWLTLDGRYPLVVERYFAGSRPMYAEFLVDDAGVRYTGHGELLMAPTLDGLVVPAPGLDPRTRNRLIGTCRRVCETFHAFGYRGTMSVDGILTPDGQLLLNESNSRISGGTHLHDVIGRRLVGERSLGELDGRTALERGGWAVPSFGAAVEALERAGLAYDRERRTGVVLVCDFGPLDGTVRYCVLAEDLDAARAIEARLPELFPGRRAEPPPNERPRAGRREGA